MMMWLSELVAEISAIFNTQVPRKPKKVRGLITPARAIQLWHKRYMEFRPKPYTLDSSLVAMTSFDYHVYTPWAVEKKRHCDAFTALAKRNPARAYHLVLNGRVLYA